MPLHHWAATALSGHESGEASALMASDALALATVDLLHNSATVQAAQSERARRVTGLAFTAPLLGGFDVLARAPERFWDATSVSENGPEL